MTRSRYSSGPTYIGPSNSGHSHGHHGHGHDHHHHNHGGVYYYNTLPFFGSYNGYWGSPYGFSNYYSTNTFYGPGTSFSYGTYIPGPYTTYDPLVVPYYNGLNGYTTIPNSNLIPLDAAKAEEERRWQQELDFQQAEFGIAPAKKSTAVERLRSQQDQMRGDEYFRKQQFSLAVSSYLKAAEHAEDLADPVYRLSVANAALGNFERAVKHLKHALDLEPASARTGIDLDRMYGNEFVMARDSMLSRMTKWVEQDIRDPDRLLLMGAFLYRDAPDKAVVFLETSARLSGQTHYVAPFLADANAKAEVAENLQQKHVVEPGDASPHVIVPQKQPDVAAPPAPGVDPTNVPPLPEGTNDTVPNGEAAAPYQPKNLGFILPRHGGQIPPVVTPEPTVELDGPRLPPLGN